MGTTLVALDLVGGTGVTSATVASVGDSRLYRRRGGVLWRVTVDHAREAEMLACGAPPEAARRSRHVVTKCSVLPVLVEVDVSGSISSPGTKFLLCSDGSVTTAAAAGGRDEAAALVVRLLTAGDAQTQARRRDLDRFGTRAVPSVSHQHAPFAVRVAVTHACGGGTTACTQRDESDRVSKAHCDGRTAQRSDRRILERVELDAGC